MNTDTARTGVEILVFSDSHGDDTLMRRALRAHPGADVIHLGDGLDDLDALDLSGRRVVRVLGNHEDFYFRFTGQRSGIPIHDTLEAGEIRIFATHGHHEGVKSGYDAAASLAVRSGCDVLLFGHTHSALDEYLPEGTRVGGAPLERPMHVVNPGSAGSGYDASCAILTIRGGELLVSFLTD